MTATAQPESGPPRRGWRRFLFPLIVLLVVGLLQALFFVWAQAEWPAEALGPLFGLRTLAMILAVPALLVWWVFFSGFAWALRLGLLAVVVAAAVGFLASIRKFELTSAETAGLRPRMQFRWEPTPEERLEKHQASLPPETHLPPIDLTVGPDDFPQYRGKDGDGHASLPDLATAWDSQPPTLLWKQPTGGGYSGIAVAGNVAVTLEQRGDDEAVVCYDRGTGRERWLYAYPALHGDVMGDGPRSTPLIDKGEVFTFGATGVLTCIEGKTGQRKWQVNAFKDSQAPKMKWGNAGSPILVGNVVVVHPGQDPAGEVRAGLAGYDRASGKRLWASGRRRGSYSTPRLVDLAGVPQILVFDGEGLTGHNPQDGKILWHHPWVTMFEMNSMQPLVLDGDRVFISSEVTNGCALVQVLRAADGTWSTKELWKNSNMACKFSNPVTDGKLIFGLNSGTLACLDAADGKRLWRGKRYGDGQMLLVGAYLLIVGDQGELALVKAESKGGDEIARFEVFGDKTWNTPSLAGDQLFIRNQAEIACLRLPQRTVAAFRQRGVGYRP